MEIKINPHTYKTISKDNNKSGSSYNNLAKIENSPLSVRVKVLTGKSKNKVIEENDKYLVYVRAKKRNMQANQAVLNAMASFLKVDKSDIRIIKGLKSPNKTLEVL